MERWWNDTDTEKQEYSEQNLASVLLDLSQISQGMALNQNQASTVTHHRLGTWDTVEH